MEAVKMKTAWSSTGYLSVGSENTESSVKEIEMASGQIAKPGSKYGPCKSCEHVDCQKSREMAQTLCGLCAKEIGYETGFYIDEGNLVHGYCFEDKYLTAEAG